MTGNEIHEFYMRRAIYLARQAASMEEVPVGAVVVDSLALQDALVQQNASVSALESFVLGEASNLRETKKQPTAHAEVLALEEAALHKKAWRLLGTTLYVTLEPCLMCAGALINSRVEKVVFGARDPKAGAVKSLFQVLEDPRLNHRCQIIEGVLDHECAELLKKFFSSLRMKEKTKRRT